MSTKFVGTFSFPAPGGRTYCLTDVYSYTPQVPTQPPPIAPAAHLNTPNSMLLLLGDQSSLQVGTVPLVLGELHTWQQQGSRRLGTAAASQPPGDTPRPTPCRYLITELVQPSCLAKRASGSFWQGNFKDDDRVMEYKWHWDAGDVAQHHSTALPTWKSLQDFSASFKHSQIINQTIYPATLQAFHPNCAGKAGKGLYGTSSPYQVSRKSVADLDVFQGELTMAATQILGRFSMHTLYTWNLHHACVGFALFFLKFSETYHMVKKLERIANGPRDSRCAIFKK